MPKHQLSYRSSFRQTDPLPEPVVQIAQSIVRAFPDTSNEDLEIALRLRLQHQQIAFKAAYLIFLEQERRALKQEEEVLLLLLH